ncbi:hypothetical protein ACFVXC_15030 [Streptomyces sp. NPDC058257]|uniref:hypothetical protein n=1 Tax=Streptomyces sp. NPDC058257 TaxID=3346409 RepID=UPI0036EBFDC9
MKKITTLAVLALGAVALATPAHADDGDDGVVNAVAGWAASAATVGMQELADASSGQAHSGDILTEDQPPVR